MRIGWCRAVLLFSVAALLLGCSAPADLGMASGASQRFHDRFNRQEYAGIYADADQKFREATKQEVFTSLLARIHNQLGKVTDATRTGFNVNYNIGESTITLVYSTKFQLGQAQEQFIWLKSDDTVRLLRYNIQSSALDDSNLQ